MSGWELPAIVILVSIMAFVGVVLVILIIAPEEKQNVCECGRDYGGSLPPNLTCTTCGKSWT